MAGWNGSAEIEVRVGSRIRLRRRWLGVTQGRLARAVGVTFQQIQKYECGASRVSARRLVEIAAALETSVAFLVGEDRDASIGEIIFADLETPGALDLLAAFNRINDGDARFAVLKLTQGLADGRPFPANAP